MTQTVKPVIIKQSAYLRVPNDVAELLDIMGAPTGVVELQIDEKDAPSSIRSQSKSTRSQKRRPKLNR